MTPGLEPSAIVESVCRPVGAPPKTVFAIIERLDSLRALKGALKALGLEDYSVEPVDRTHSQLLESTVLISWALPSAGSATITYTVGVGTHGDGGSLVTATIRAETAEDAAQGRLVDAWPLIGPALSASTKRLFEWVTELVEEADDDVFKGGRE